MKPVRRVASAPFDDQRPGTSGLRKRTERFRTPHYLENFLQAVFDTCPELCAGTLVVGGDGRFFNDSAIRTALHVAAGNGVGRIIAGCNGILSTPAASGVIREYGAAGGLIFSASHNPGGADGDFGIKVNLANGGPAPERITEAIFRRSCEVDAYCLADLPKINLAQSGSRSIGRLNLEVIDPVAGYADMMERLFDFDRIATAIRSGKLRFLFDAMHAVTGPYAHEIFVGRLGAPEESLMHAVPREDFGGGAPDPGPERLPELAVAMRGTAAPDLGAASDGDGDRNLILGRDRQGRDFWVSPSDSLAILVANADAVPGYADGVAGVARSMPTSRAVDRVAEAAGFPCYETPTGWRFFGSLLDAGRITFCGEESAGTGSDHVREKDGIWAVLFWLNLLAVRGIPVSGILEEHWHRFGRHYHTRHDWEAIEEDLAQTLMANLRGGLADLSDRNLAGRNVLDADDFRYVDPIDGAVAEEQGVRIFLEDGGRIVFRLSGTGTRGATLRIYVEDFEPPEGNLFKDPQRHLAPLVQAAVEIGDLAQTGRKTASLVV